MAKENEFAAPWELPKADGLENINTNSEIKLDEDLKLVDIVPDIQPAAMPPSMEENVIVTVPKNFQLYVDHSTVKHFKAGVQQMDRNLAEHWWSKANGVKIYSADKE